MKGSRFRIQIAALIFIMLPAAAGVVAIRASATCERFVKTYITKPVRNRVSKTTETAWEQWRIAHPDWKPNPDLHRPKYVMNREEGVQKIEFACTVPLINLVADGDLDTPPPAIVNFPPMQATQIEFPEETPPEVAEITPEDSWPPVSPFVPPVLAGVPLNTNIVSQVVPPVVPGPTPEPGSLLLVATGMSFAAVFIGRQLRTNKPSA